MATIKHIFKGESLSMLFTLPAEYDMARIQSHGVWIGGTEFTGVIIGQGIELKLTSLQTDLMSGNQRVSLWIDDTILGVRKPYVGDIAVGNTNALPDNESTSEVYDVIVNVDISVTSIEAGDLMFNYVKGDPFTYADFTPEQIAELQQPATDAIASIQATELAVEQAEELRVTAEGTRQTNTAIAITNANDAALLANEKAGLADTAANNANEKATLANDAAILANEKAGLADAAATNANNVANTYAAELALKELKANKQNSLAADGTGTKFPTVDAVNTGLALKQDKNLIAEYIHNANIEVSVSSYDINTDTFTSINHGLVNGDVIAPTLNNLIYEVYPMTLYIGGMENVHYYVINKTDNTFQISKTNGGATINLTTLATTDLAKWHFEKMTAFIISNLPASRNIKIIGSGKLINAFNTTYLAPTQMIDSGWSKKTSLSGCVTIFGNSSNGIMLDMDIQSANNSFVRWRGWAINNNTLTSNTATEINDIAYKNRDYGDITSLTSNGTGTIWFNGFSIKIYKL